MVKSVKTFDAILDLFRKMKGAFQKIFLWHKRLYVHSLHGAPRTGGLVAMKLDMEKAYNQVYWPFLNNILHQFGFHWSKFFISFFTGLLVNGFSLLEAFGKAARSHPTFFFFFYVPKCSRDSSIIQ